METLRGSKHDRLLTAAILAVLVLTIAVGAWLVYFMFVRPSIAVPQLPNNVVDLRTKPMPGLASLTEVSGADLPTELTRENLLVAFLLTTCPACNLARPVLDELWLEGNVGVVGIFAESSEAVESYNTRFPRFNDQGREVFEAFGALTLPAVYIVRDGTIIEQTAGWSTGIEKIVRASIKGGE